MNSLPNFPGDIRKNDGIFLYGACQSLPFIFTYEQKSVEIVYGPSCKPEKELKLNACLQDNIPVNRRRGGGGTVVLSPGMVVLIVVGERRDSESALSVFNRIHDAMITVFNEAEICTIEKKGISDLTLNGSKILGSSLYMGSNPAYYYYQSSLMVSSQISLLERYLEYPPREPDYRLGRGHGTFCTTLEKQGFSISANEVCLILNTRLKETLSLL